MTVPTLTYFTEVWMRQTKHDSFINAAEKDGRKNKV